MQAEAVRMMAPITVEVTSVVVVFGIIWLVGLLAAVTWITFKKEEED